MYPYRTTGSDHRSSSITPVQPKHPLAPAPHRGLHHLRELAQRALILHAPRHAPRFVSGDAERALERSLARGPAEGVQLAEECGQLWVGSEGPADGE